MLKWLERWETRLERSARARPYLPYGSVKDFGLYSESNVKTEEIKAEERSDTIRFAF